MTYAITSRDGVPHGDWEGKNKAEALAAMHREAGYTVAVEDGDVVFEDDDTGRLCGYVGDWHFDEVARR